MYLALGIDVRAALMAGGCPAPTISAMKPVARLIAEQVRQVKPKLQLNLVLIAAVLPRRRRGCVIPYLPCTCVVKYEIECVYAHLVVVCGADRTERKCAIAALEVVFSCYGPSRVAVA